jgi:hypothetical protein
MIGRIRQSPQVRPHLVAPAREIRRDKNYEDEYRKRLLKAIEQKIAASRFIEFGLPSCKAGMPSRSQRARSTGGPGRRRREAMLPVDDGQFRGRGREFIERLSPKVVVGLWILPWHA